MCVQWALDEIIPIKRAKYRSFIWLIQRVRRRTLIRSLRNTQGSIACIPIGTPHAHMLPGTHGGWEGALSRKTKVTDDCDPS